MRATALLLLGLLALGQAAADMPKLPLDGHRVAEVGGGRGLTGAPAIG